MEKLLVCFTQECLGRPLPKATLSHWITEVKQQCVQEGKTTSATWCTGTFHLWSCNLLGAVERSILSRDLLSYLIDSVNIYLIPLTECACIHSFPGVCFMCYSAVGRVCGSPLGGPAVSGLCWGATLSDQLALHLPDPLSLWSLCLESCGKGWKGSLF